MANLKAYISDRIFTGEAWLADPAVLIENGLITDVIPAALLPEGIESEKFPNGEVTNKFISYKFNGTNFVKVN